MTLGDSKVSTYTTMLVHWAMPVFQELLPKGVLAQVPQIYCNPSRGFEAVDKKTMPCCSGIAGDLQLKGDALAGRPVDT